MSCLLDEFLELTSYSVPSKHESEIRKCLKQKLLALGFQVSEDNAFPETDSGSLYGFLPGTIQGDPIMFTAHMDTVTPCENKNITVEPDGTIHTDGTTILGGDDVTGIVEFLEAIRQIQAENLPHRDVEIIFTASEEFFVEGAKRLDYSRIRSKQCYVLDTDGEIGRAVLAAPTGVRVMANITGKAAHAALAPEKGINAIAVAANAISRMKLGRINEETTANIGVIQGGQSGNIVPENCFVEGETRSLNHAAAMELADHMVSCFYGAAEEMGAQAHVTAEPVYHAWSVSEDDLLCRRFQRAAVAQGLTPFFERACGGSDANFLSAHSISCLVLATGMHEIHSVREYTTLAEMETMAKVVKHIICDQD